MSSTHSLTSVSFPNGTGTTSYGAGSLDIQNASAITVFGVSAVGDVAVLGTVDGRDVAADGTAQDSHIANTNNPHNVTAAQLGIIGAAQSNTTALVDPTVTDDVSSGYDRLSVWINTNTSVAFMCVDPSVGAANWQRITPSGIPVGDFDEVFSDVTFSTTSTAYVLIPGMTFTPVAGRYYAYFNGGVSHTNNNTTLGLIFVKGGIQVAQSERFFNTKRNTNLPVTIHMIDDFSGTETLEVQIVASNNNGFSCFERSMVLIRVA